VHLAIRPVVRDVAELYHHVVAGRRIIQAHNPSDENAAASNASVDAVAGFFLPL